MLVCFFRLLTTLLVSPNISTYLRKSCLEAQIPSPYAKHNSSSYACPDCDQMRLLTVLDAVVLTMF